LASSYKQRRQQLPGQQPGGPKDQLGEQLPDFERVVQGEELSAAVAEQLVPQLGNEAVLALLARSGSTDLSAEAEVEKEEDEVLEIDEELDEIEVQVKALFGGGGSAGDGADGNPWEMGRLFGGDDDPETSETKSAGPRMSAPATATSSPTEPHHDEEEELPADAFDRIQHALGTTPALSTEQRTGDARYQAVEPGLTRPAAIGRRPLTPEALIDRTDHLDPIGRPAAMGRFLAGSATSLETRILARVLAGPASGVLPPASGHAGASARLATLAVCAEATEGSWEDTDRAVALCMVRDAWPDAVLAARTVAQEGKLVAPAILAHTIGQPLVRDAHPAAAEGRRAPLATIRLGAEALERIIPEAQIPLLPPVTAPDKPPDPSSDPDLAAADAALARFTGGTDPTDLPSDPVLERAAIRPLLDATTRLINAMGRAQVEFAAAALAIERVRPGCQLQQTLVHADQALRNLARSAVQQGDRLHQATGRPLATVQDLPLHIHTHLRASADALRGLRSWAMTALSQELMR